MMSVPNEEIGFTKNSPDALSFSLSPSIQRQNIQQCLKNIFQTPAQGIEEAFNIIVKSLEEQHQESQKLLSDHKLLKEENLLLTETLKKIETKLKASETREIKLEERMESLDKQSKNLRTTLSNSSGLGGKDVAMASDLTSLQQEVRMMAFNLELDNVPAIAEAADELVQPKKFNDEKKDENVEVSPPALSQLSNNSQQTIERHDKELADSSPNTKCHVAETRSFENTRGSRVGKFRFDVQDTLAARLRRLEVDKDNLKTQLINIKGMIKNDKIDLTKRVVSIETFLEGFDEANGETLTRENLPLTNNDLDLVDNNSDTVSSIEAESISNPLITFSATTDSLPRNSDTERPLIKSLGEINDGFIKKADQTSRISEACATKNDLNIVAASANEVKPGHERYDHTRLSQSKEIDHPENSFTGKLYESSDKAKDAIIKGATALQTLEVGAETSQNQRDLAISMSSTEINRAQKSSVGRVNDSLSEHQVPEADTVKGDFSTDKLFANGVDSNHSGKTVLDTSNVINKHPCTLKVDKSANNTEADTQISNICIVQDIGLGAEPIKSDDKKGSAIPAKDMDNPHGNSHKETKKKQHIRNFSKRQSLFRHLEEQEYRFKDSFEDMSSRLRALEILCNGRESQGLLTPNFLASKDSVSTKGSEAIDEGDVISDDSKNQTLHNSVAKLMADIDSKVSKEFLDEELKTISPHSSIHPEKNGEIEFVMNGDNFNNFKSHVQNQLLFLEENKVNLETLNNALSSSNDIFQQKVDVSLAEQDKKIKTSFSTLHLAVKECKENIRVIDSQLLSPINPSNTDLETRMKDALESMESNLREELTSRLQCLKQIEDNVERFASQLAEIPDQDQIKKMLGDLENVGLQHAEDDTVHGIIENMKNELKEKMTKEQVLGLVRQILRGAKDLITRNATNDSSLMVGYRCIGCSNYNPQGVNKTIASKVNHNKLPHGKGFSSSAFPHFNKVSGQTAKFTKGNVTSPVYYRRDTPSSFIRRSRTPLSFGLRRSRLQSSTRPISADK